MRFWDKVMMSLEGVGIAFDAIRANKVRAALTISGVAVGVFVVVAMGATIHGVRQSFQTDLEEFGANTFQVRRRGVGFSSCDGTDENCPDRRNPRITIEDWTAILELRISILNRRLPILTPSQRWSFASRKSPLGCPASVARSRRSRKTSSSKRSRPTSQAGKAITYSSGSRNEVSPPRS